MTPAKGRVDDPVRNDERAGLGRLLLSGWTAVGRSAAGVVLLCTLVPLGVTNMWLRAGSAEVEDGVLWAQRPEGVVAVELAPRGAASRAGVRPGDLLLSIDGRAIDHPADALGVLDSSPPGRRLRYSLAREGVTSVVELELLPIPRGNTALYFVLASVGLFSLLVGVGVRLRRPGAPVSLHFLWLSAAFFGTFTFSFNGRLDRLDWFFYWADAVASLALPPLFLHFTLVFPERPRRWASTAMGRYLLPLLYLPALLLGALRVVAVRRAPSDASFYVGLLGYLDRIDPLYLSACLIGGFAVLVSAFSQVRSLTAKRQLRWIVWGTGIGVAPFAFGYALPFAAGIETTLSMDLSAVPLGLVPLAFASAIVRYRLRDVEVIIKRVLVWSVAFSAIGVIYALLLRVAAAVFLEDAHGVNSVIAMLATLVVVLLARPVKEGIQAAIDRAFYRDRYDYRRALVGFARDLSTELDLARLGERLISRVTETLLVDRMVLLLVDPRTHGFVPFRAEGLPAPAPALPRASGLTRRLASGQLVTLDESASSRNFESADIDPWLEQEVYTFVPCLSKEGAIAVLALGRKRHGDPLTSEDTGLLSAVAAQVAIAFENGRLYQQLHQTAQEIDRLREFSDSIIESLDVGLVVVDRRDIVIRWNRSMERLAGRPRHDALGRRLDQLFDGGFIEALDAGRHTGQVATTLARVPLPVGRDGAIERLLVNATTVPLQSPSAAGVAGGTILILDDVTERVQLEEQLQISDKMASIGLLAAGVAHEVNTPLTGISSFTQMLLEGAEPSDPRTRLLEKIEQQTFRAARIVNGLLNLSRPSSGGDRAHVDLNAVVNDVLALLEHQFKVGKIQVRRELAPQGPVVFAVEYKLQQVLLNLLLNAHDAMPKGGWLSVTTRTDGDQAVVEVADTGSGIPAEHLGRIYDPFFTTKAMGRGTGLGLSITYGIVREHDGTIDCDSQVGVGTRFTLSFPLAAAAVERASRAAT